MGYWLFAIGLGRDHRRSATRFDSVSDVIAVIAPVSQEHAGRCQVVVDQSIEAFEVGYFTSRYFRPDREAVSVGKEVNLGREATL